MKSKKPYVVKARRWRYFDSMLEATKAASRIFERTGVVVAIENNPNRRPT
jgi:hypothetical protein